MKKLFIAAGLLSLWSCSDMDFNEPEQTESSAKFIAQNLMDFDENLLGTDPTANKVALQTAIDYVRDNPNLYDGLQIGKVDCFVDVSAGALKLPSNFALIMSEGTTLRVYSTVTQHYNLIEIGGAYDNGVDIENVTIEGGNLIGDRLQNTNLGEPTGHLIMIRSAHHIHIEGTSMTLAYGDGLCQSSKYLNGNPNYTTPTDLTIYNCYFSDNRRNNVSIVDGDGVEILDSEFHNAGSTIGASPGRLPRCSVDIEGFRIWADPEHTQLFWYQHPTNVTISGNVESGSPIAFYAATTDHVVIENNTSTGTIGYMTGDHITVRNNTSNGSGVGVGIQAGTGGYTTVVHNNVIEGNRVYNYAIGIDLRNNETVVTGNDISDCTMGIQCFDIREVEIFSNKIASNAANSRGIALNQTTADELDIHHNEVNVLWHGISLSGVNKSSAAQGFRINISNNLISSGGQMLCTNSNGVGIFENGIYANGGVMLTNGITNVDFHHNTVILPASSSAHAVTLGGSNGADGLHVRYNDISHASTSANVKCIYAIGLANSDITKNTLTHNVSKTLYIANSSDSDVSGNVGDIGNSQYFIHAGNVTNVNFNNNTAVLSPHTRQLINGVSQIF